MLTAASPNRGDRPRMFVTERVYRQIDDDRDTNQSEEA